MRKDYADIYKPFIATIIKDVYNNDTDFIDFYNSDDFTEADKHTYLVKLVFRKIKRDAMLTRMDRSLKNRDIKQTAKDITALIDSLIVLEQGIYEVMFMNDDPGSDDLIEGITELYGGKMNIESTELFEIIRGGIDELNLF